MSHGVLRIEAGFPPGTRAGDRELGDLRVHGDLGSWSTGPGSRVPLVPTIITMAGELLAWCRKRGGPATLHSSEGRRLIILDDLGDDRFRVSGPDGPLHVADAWEICVVFHTAAIALVDRRPALSWTGAEDDFWAVLAAFRVQCLPGYVAEE